MRHKILYFLSFLLLLHFSFVFAETKSLTLPKGTSVEKLGNGHFRFTLPNKKIIEVKNFDPKSGNIGYIAIIDPDPPNKPVVLSNQARFIGQKIKALRIPSGTEYVIIDDDPTWIRVCKRVSKSDYIIIDDEPTWLPAAIQFETQGLQKLSPQPDPPGSLKR
ncbi:MAG: hypothetical protein N2Z79_03610 [Candidatus Omnitrophica bacterium]|nr:hypothetical protein [Candidatus Omnitrophota bacterium]